MSVREIAETEEFGYMPNTIFKKIKEFEESGYIGRGLKEGRADTFFITSAGCEFLERAKKNT
jgi:predicted transcriptional regulator